MKVSKNIILTLVVICSFFIFFGLDWFFRVKTISIKGVPKIEISGLFDVRDKSLLFLNTTSLQNELLKNNPGISSILLTKKFPSTLLVSYVQRAPIGVLDGADGFFYLSEEAMVLKKEKNTPAESVPAIHHTQKYYFNSYKIGDQIPDAEVVFAAKIIPQLQNQGLRIKSVDIVNTNMILCNSDDFTIAMSADKQAQLQVEQAKFVIDRLGITGKTFKKLDVRFDKPIITQ